MTEITSPTIVAFEVTGRCPLHCRHCRAAAGSDQPDDLSTDPCKRILDAIAQLHKCVVVLTGGEPMMRDDIFDLVDYGQSIGHRMAIATCGALLDESAIRRFKQVGLLSFSFSLDGPDAQSHDNFRQVPGAFDTAIKAIRLARTIGVRFQINTTVSAYNADKLDTIAQMAIDLGAACWNPFMLVPVGRAAQDKELLLSPEQYEAVLVKLARIKKDFPIELRVTCGPQFVRIARQKDLPGADHIRGCLAAGGFAFISRKGDVQTCGFLGISAGNLLENGYNFVDIWHHSPLLNTIRDTAAYKGCCRCEYLDDCRGCRARAYADSGNVLGPDPMCNRS